jgi:hypothetical protein
MGHARRLRVDVAWSTRRRAPPRGPFLLLIALFHAPGFTPPARAELVSGLAALHHDGQTFLTWNSPPGSGWTYRVYAAPSAIESEAGLTSAALLGMVGDSSWCDRRLYSVSGTAHGYAVDSAAAPLGPGHGLFVRTASAPGLTGYAVTCQAAGGVEDRAVVPGNNSLVLPISETPALPRPVYQRTLIGELGKPADVYTLWTGNDETPLFPAMCNRRSEAYDCSVLRGAAGAGLMFHAHYRGGSFYLAQIASGTPGEWVIMMDDFIRTPSVNTFWFGYHEDYDIESFASQGPPVAGTVSDFTARRVIFTLEWARRNFAVDTTRVYVVGSSMGGIAAVFLPMWRPDLIAAAMASVPLFDFSYLTDPNPLCQINTGGGTRWTFDRLWGEVPTDLRMEDGTRVYDRLNCGALAAGLETRFVPPLFTFSGRNDIVLGWAQAIPFYRSMNQHRGGGTFFWDNSTHSNSGVSGAWQTMKDLRYLYRFRTDLSFPALSNCSANGNPGYGAATDGDSVGTINGFVEWDPEIVDQPGLWRVQLRLRDLTSMWGVVHSPASVRVDVTPRRLQSFAVTPGQSQGFWVTRLDDGSLTQSGLAIPDAMGVLTIPAVIVPRSGCRLEVGSLGGIGAPDWVRPRIGPLPFPIRGPIGFAVEWPRTGDATLLILDVAGRAVQTLHRGTVERGRQSARIDPAGLPNGIYFIAARDGASTAARRFAVVR